MSEPRRIPRETPDPLLEALVDLARSAIANRREAEARRGKMVVVTAKRGRAA